MAAVGIGICERARSFWDLPERKLATAAAKTELCEWSRFLGILKKSYLPAAAKIDFCERSMCFCPNIWTSEFGRGSGQILNFEYCERSILDTSLYYWDVLVIKCILSVLEYYICSKSFNVLKSDEHAPSEQCFRIEDVLWMSSVFLKWPILVYS